MAEFLNPQDLQTLKDIKEAIEKIKKLSEQKENPDRNGMIEALCSAKSKAPLEITAIELIQGDTHPMPFTSFSNSDLYRKLSQYQKGLENYCIAKVGEEVLKKLLKDDNQHRS